MELKGIIHCHSTYSYDAKLTLRELKDLCLKNGVSFVCMTEHVDEMTKESALAFVRECEELSDDTFLFIPGFEVPYASQVHAGTHAHILMIGQREFFGNYAPDIETLRVWTKETSFVILAHPVRNQFLVDDGLLGEIDSLEVWNQQYEGKRVPRTRSLRLLGELRKKKPELLATGGVDFHRTEHFGSPLVTLNVAVCTEAAILEKLQTGVYRTSSEYASFLGTCPNPDTLSSRYRLQSCISVVIINLGKIVNAVLAKIGIKLPKQLKQFIRRRL